MTTNTYDQTQQAGTNGGAPQYGLLSYSIDGNGHKTSFAYSYRNEVVGAYLPDGTSETSAYDAGGRKVSHTDANGAIIKYAYTNTDRLNQTIYAAGKATTFTYKNAVQRVSMTDGTGTTAWTYDPDERVTSLASPNGTVGYAYDAADRATSQTDGNGAVVSYSYNDLDEVTAEATVTSGGSQIAGDTYTYYANGTVHAKTDFDGSTTTYAYDGADQLTSETRTGPNAYSVSYTYDHNSNRLSKTVGGSTDAYVYDAADKLLHTSTKTFTYDSNGNRLTQTVGGVATTYNWDYEDRLTSISGTSSTNTYNGLDLRVARTSTTGAASYYTCDGATPASPVLRDGPDVYTEGLSQTLTATGATSFYVLDRLGSDTRMMNSAQAVTDTQVYDGFGASVVRTGSTNMPFGFVAKSGYETDSDTGLMLLGHRFYDPSIGRFLSRDPIHDGPNDYAYCGNNPITAVDPTGEAESRGSFGVGDGTFGVDTSWLSGDDADFDPPKESNDKGLAVGPMSAEGSRNTNAGTSPPSSTGVPPAPPTAGPDGVSPLRKTPHWETNTQNPAHDDHYDVDVAQNSNSPDPRIRRSGTEWRYYPKTGKWEEKQQRVAARENGLAQQRAKDERIVEKARQREITRQIRLKQRQTEEGGLRPEEEGGGGGLSPGEDYRPGASGGDAGEPAEGEGGAGEGKHPDEPEIPNF